MDDRLSFDVYAEITDPPWRIEYEAYESRVSVVIGGPQKKSPPANLFQLWFKDPDTVVTLGRELTTAGMRLAAQLRTLLPDSADSDQRSCEESPVSGTKADILEPGEEL